jgi:FkbM family methyltransferase
MDVGASAINEAPIYKRLVDRGLAHLHAFEGDDRQIEGIKSTYGAKATIHKDFLYDGSERTLYVASSASGMTSLLKPRTAALKFFNGFEHFGHIEKTLHVQTKRLDQVEDIPLVDLAKMDIQGAELTVLKNGTQKLHNCVALQLEVSWIGLYENQPPFGEVDVWLRSQGFAPHRFLEVKRWSITPTVFNNNFRNPGHQLLESDIVYIKDPLALEQLSRMQLKKLSVMAHYCFQSPDLCAHLLRELEKRGNVSIGAHVQYLNALPAL